MIYLFFSICRHTNTTNTVVIRPKEGVWGRFNFTAGELTYYSEDNNELKSGFTSEPGEGFIVSLKEFDKRFSPHYVNYLITIPFKLLILTYFFLTT